MVELKARFDEERQHRLGAQPSSAPACTWPTAWPGSRRTAKVALVVRREGDGMRRYVHIGTGNYNPKTARVYTDLGLLTADPSSAPT